MSGTKIRKHFRSQSDVSSRTNRFSQSARNRAVHCLSFVTFSFFLFTSPPVRADDVAKQSVVVVVGATGAPEYEKEFTGWAEQWKTAATKGGADFVLIGTDENAAKPQALDRDRLKNILERAADTTDQELWLVLIGHGTFDGRTARFNLRGPDVSATDLAEWLKPLKRPVAVVNCGSASGPFVNKLSAANRVIVTAAKSGSEQNFARFGKYLSASIADAKADLDKDGQTSLLEAWLSASRKVEEFYKTEGRLATEHSLLEDNGDGRAVRADFFRGIRPNKKSADNTAIDGYRAHQFHLVRSPEEHRLPPELRRHRDELELSVIQLRDRKETIPQADYTGQLEALLIELAKVYEQSAGNKGTIVPASGERRK
ncbi:MAG: hypothetical protein HON53_13805 [Planctomycetaceae bacterium]|jgi:hypothetical protein|nr:hypothetical protein [Planctomycetaceae bacterium]MBT6155148.1 hypothetical protein [Planctomycetaceae bacterium]MBT6483336.1 hypothetical protein [Planctomycetaceae bacterium]MBT6493869.1 hypothetical protein [Planctomycetaceae bacterium]